MQRSRAGHEDRLVRQRAEAAQGRERQGCRDRLGARHLGKRSEDHVPRCRRGRRRPHRHPATGRKRDHLLGGGQCVEEDRRADRQVLRVRAPGLATRDRPRRQARALRRRRRHARKYAPARRRLGAVRSTERSRRLPERAQDSRPSSFRWKETDVLAARQGLGRCADRILRALLLVQLQGWALSWARRLRALRRASEHARLSTERRPGPSRPGVRSISSSAR